MGAYATVALVQARNPYRAIGASTEPSTADVEEWIDQAEAEIDGRIAAAGLTSPVVNTNGIKIVRKKVVGYVAGFVEMAYAAAGGDGGNDDGQDAQELWDECMEDITDNPLKWGGILEGGTAPESSIQMRSHTTNNKDGLTVAAGDFAPTYHKDDVF